MLKRLSLRQEILLILAIKLILLFILWIACFSHPLDENLKPTDIRSHLTSTTNQREAL